MKIDKMRSLGLAVVCLLLLACCFDHAAAFEVKDSLGTRLELTARPQRVVSLVGSATEILFALGASDQVAGITYHDETLEGAVGKKIVGGFFNPSIVKIKEIGPDLVIAANFHSTLMAQVKEWGCPVFVFNNRSLDTAYENVILLGRLMGREDKALEIVAQNRADLAHIKAKVAKLNLPAPLRVIRLMGRDRIMTPGADSFQSEMIRAAGGTPPDFGKNGSIVDVTLTEWKRFNPQVIYGCSPDQVVADRFFSQPGWRDVDAVKNNRIYYFPCDLTCRVSTRMGYFVSWLSSCIYPKEFSAVENLIDPLERIDSRPVRVDLDLVESAAIEMTHVYDFRNKTLVVDFKEPQTILSTLEGWRDNITAVGNHYSPPPTWMPGHYRGVKAQRAAICKALGRDAKNFSFLITGADMDNLSVGSQQFKKMKVTALVTAGVMGNALRMGKDVGGFYEPGTINIILMTNFSLSKRAMSRAIITGTEAKTAALQDLDIRSSQTPGIHEATGTGTDNILVVQGMGPSIENSGGHSKMGELIARAVYQGVTQAVLKQNRVTGERSIFQRLRERKISVHQVTADAYCDCLEPDEGPGAGGAMEMKKRFSAMVEHLLLDPSIAGFMESAMALSDEYEKGLIHDLASFDLWCEQMAMEISHKRVEVLDDLVVDEKIPLVIQKALNAVMTGARIRVAGKSET